MSGWTDFVKAYAAKHKVMYKDALKPASVEWAKKKPAKDAKPAKGTKGAKEVSEKKSKVKKDGQDKDFETKKGDQLKTGKDKGKKEAFEEKKEKKMAK